MKTLPIAVSANFTAEPIEPYLASMLTRVSIAAEVTFAPYNQVFQQLLNPTSLLATCTGVNVLLVSLEEWLTEGGTAGEEFGAALAEASMRAKASFVVGFCPPSPALRDDPARFQNFAAAEDALVAKLASQPSVFVIPFTEWATHYRFGESWDAASYRLGHVPYTPDFFLCAAAVIARRIHALTAPPYKVLVLDCDNTLWRGVCGEDGAAGVGITDAYLDLQRFAVTQIARGMLVCLASRNNEDDAWAVFSSRPEMVLRREQITAWRINWQDKSKNLMELAAELSLSLESFVFIDDDAAVCAEVRARCPEVLVLQLPAPHQVGSLLARTWAFDRPRITAEDAGRADSYRHAAERECLRKASASMDDFLAKLGLEVFIEPSRPEQLARVAQLTLRTNQFNSTTIRRNEPELASLLAGNMCCAVVSVKDRFGDYGLVGVLLFRLAGDALTVDSLLLSCRALGRGVEHRMVAYLGQAAIEHGLASVAIDFVASAKNAPAREFLSSLQPDLRKVVGDGKIVYRLGAETAAAIKFDGTAPERREVQEVVAPPATDYLSDRVRALSTIAAEWVELSDVRAALSAGSRDASAIFEYEDETEKTIAGFLAAALNRGPVGPEEDFFDLGGDSLIAVQVFAEIERHFDKALTIASLFDARSPRALARLVRAESQLEVLSLVPIQPEGFLPPLYCIHAAGGNVLFYRDLSHWLGRDQPVYGLQAVGLKRKHSPHMRVEDMAAHYIGEMVAFQPEGPYHLCGSSFGGLVAFEMARQLRAAGHDVGLVALLDTYGPGYPVYRSGLSRAWSRLVIRVQTQYINLRPLNWIERLSYIRGKAGKARRLARRQARQSGNNFMRQFYQKTGRELPQHLVVAQNAIDIARRNYSPQFYEGQVTLLRAATQPSGILPDPALGWKDLTPTLTIHETRGTHGAVTTDPHARGTAGILARCLSEARCASPVEQANAAVAR